MEESKAVIRLLIDTSVWLDLAKRRDGQTWIMAVRSLVSEGTIELLVPAVILDEFERNRGPVATAMTVSVAERFRLLRRDIDAYGGEDPHDGLDLLDSLAHYVPLIGAMTTRNFTDIADLLHSGRRLTPTSDDYARVVQRGMEKKAPCHRSKNSVADALLIELYRSTLADADLASDLYCFATSNHDDFSGPTGDRRLPHSDLADLFVSDRSDYLYQVEGLTAALERYVGEEWRDLVAESDFQEEPRTLEEIVDAEQEFFDRVWCERHLVFRHAYESGDDQRTTEGTYRAALEAAARVRARRPDIRPVESDFEWGMWNGKLSALRWVLGSEWDFLDT